MSVVHERECEMAHLAPKTMARIARGIERYANEARPLGITVSGGDLRIAVNGDGLTDGPPTPAFTDRPSTTEERRAFLPVLKDGVSSAKIR